MVHAPAGLLLSPTQVYRLMKIGGCRGFGPPAAALPATMGVSEEGEAAVTARECW